MALAKERGKLGGGRTPPPREGSQEQAQLAARQHHGQGVTVDAPPHHESRMVVGEGGEGGGGGLQVGDTGDQMEGNGGGHLQGKVVPYGHTIIPPRGMNPPKEGQIVPPLGAAGQQFGRHGDYIVSAKVPDENPENL